MVINIVAGGPGELLPDLYEYNAKSTVWVGVDRGVFHLLQRKIIPNVAFGDFDSVSTEELTLIEDQVKELKYFKPEKDETDMELALNWAIDQSPCEIRLFGGTGGRLDHFLANIQLLIGPLLKGNGTEILLIDIRNKVFVKGPGSYRLEKENKKYISFIPATPHVLNLTLKGFKYPLENRHISYGSTLCISNELIGHSGTFSFSEGILIVVRSHD